MTASEPVARTPYNYVPIDHPALPARYQAGTAVIPFAPYWAKAMAAVSFGDPAPHLAPTRCRHDTLSQSKLFSNFMFQ